MPTGDKIVNAEEFCRLATSREALVRDDDSATGLRGLRDTTTGVRYICRSDHLDELSVARAGSTEALPRGA